MNGTQKKLIYIIISIAASLATIGSFALYTYDLFSIRKTDLYQDSLRKFDQKLLNMEEYNMSPWKISDISNYININEWDVFPNYNFLYANYDGMIFNGMLLNRSVESCIKKCLKYNCYFWSYEKSGWCNVFKRNNWLHMLQMTPRFGWQDTNRISARRK